MAEGTVPVSPPLRLKEIVALHCAYKVIAPVFDFQFVEPKAKFVPLPFASVFQPVNLYPVRASAVPESNVMVDIDEVTVTESGTVFDEEVFPFPSYVTR